MLKNKILKSRRFSGAHNRLELLDKNILTTVPKSFSKVSLPTTLRRIILCYGPVTYDWNGVVLVKHFSRFCLDFWEWATNNVQYEKTPDLDGRFLDNVLVFFLNILTNRTQLGIAVPEDCKAAIQFARRFLIQQNDEQIDNLQPQPCRFLRWPLPLREIVMIFSTSAELSHPCKALWINTFFLVFLETQSTHI